MHILWHLIATVMTLATLQTESHQVELKLEISASQRSKGSVKKPIKIHLDISNANVNLDEIKKKVESILQQRSNDHCDVTTTNENEVFSTNDVKSTTSKKITSIRDVTTTAPGNDPTTTYDVTTTTAPGNDPTTTHDVTTTATQENVIIAKTAILDNGYKYFLLENANYTEANLSCKRFNGSLAVNAVNNYTIMETITKYLRNYHEEEVFVGFTDSLKDGTFTANDGTTIKEPEGRTPWHRNEPAGGMEGIERDCVVVFVEGDNRGRGKLRLNDIKCEQTKRGLCEADRYSASADYEKNISGFGYFLTKSKNQMEAEKLCNEKNATLAVKAVNDYSIMKEAIQGITGSTIYVGFTDTETESVFVAKDGTPLMETRGGTQWDGNHPNDTMNEIDCVVVKLYKNPKLLVSPCNHDAYALCEIPDSVQ